MNDALNYPYGTSALPATADVYAEVAKRLWPADTALDDGRRIAMVGDVASEIAAEAACAGAPAPIWYRCSGCGPSLRCPVCGANECAQNLRAEACRGCRRLSRHRMMVNVGVLATPWNMTSRRGARPLKHNRSWLAKQERHSRLFDRGMPRTTLERWVRTQGRWVRNPALEGLPGRNPALQSLIRELAAEAGGPNQPYDVTATNSTAR